MKRGFSAVPDHKSKGYEWLRMKKDMTAPTPARTIATTSPISPIAESKPIVLSVFRPYIKRLSRYASRSSKFSEQIEESTTSTIAARRDHPLSCPITSMPYPITALR
jgi:hypothetical protein